MAQNGVAQLLAGRISSGGPYFCIDVECVATAKDHNSRAVAQISLVVRFFLRKQ